MLLVLKDSLTTVSFAIRQIVSVVLRITILMNMDGNVLRGLTVNSLTMKQTYASNVKMGLN